ncbi:MAG: VWA domain-containing protein [Bacteroidetes bacterium]|nr:VWA domain-containing protein [Bacteroidota bacterium]
MHDIRNLTISSTNPCLLVYLIDQSGSMKDKFGNASHSKAVEVTNAINDIIYQVGLRCIGSGGEIRNRFEIAIVGYGKQEDAVQSGWEGQLSGKWVVSIKNIFEFPLEQDDDKPIWIKPYCVSSTPMTKAFENAKRICNDWINWGNHRDCHPPIIINITDGEATDAGSNFSAIKNEVEQIKSLRTNYGGANILNIHISTRAGDKLLFPNEVNSGDKFEKLLFEMSTPLDENMIRLAKNRGYNIENGAKAYVYNGDAVDLLNFLDIGSQLF